MSFLSWFNRKPAPLASGSSEPSGTSRPDATVPAASQNRQGRDAPQEAAALEQAGTRKSERMERRELLYTVVRDAMVRAGVLSASYKFKVLSLDQRGSQFLVMMDLAREFGGDTGRLSEIEALIARTAKSRYDIAVTAVYWRINDHVAIGIPLRSAAGVAAAAQVNAGSATSAQQRPVVQIASAQVAAGNVAPKGSAPIAPVRPAAASAPATPPAAPKQARSVFDPIEADEVAAFRKALGNASAGSTAGAPRPAQQRPDGKRKSVADDFADTEMTGNAEPAPDLGVTQYGDL